MSEKSDRSRNHLGDIIAVRMTRRGAVKGLLAGGTAAVASGVVPLRIFSQAALAAAGDPSTLSFKQADHVIKDDHHVAPGYKTQVLIRWGDKVLGDAPEWSPATQSAEAQEKQFGYNNDFVAYLPLPAGSQNSDHGLLCVNHEYTDAELMFPGLTRKTRVAQLTRDQVDIEMAAHGHTVIEIEKTGNGWQVVENSPYARRISTRSTVMEISGPAAGNDRLKTSSDATGTRVIGTLNNCAGGVTPWGTVLFAEENFHGYFGGDPAKTAEEENYRSYGIKGKSGYAWSRYHDRFDVEKEPNEPNRFGWMVEYDPYDPTSTPIKRTALGRFKHEAATCVALQDGRVVVYAGDDERFEHLYKFVSNGRVDPNNREANRDLLDDGTLFVAKFEDSGIVRWMPLVWGAGDLTPENGFKSQADVLIEARKAAKLLGATPMDRPEDVEPNLVNGRVYMMLTNNTKRKPEQIDAANPRANNTYGHILEMIPPGARGANGGKTAQHDALAFKWDIVMLCGDPKNPEHGAKYHPQISQYGSWLAAPDNCTFDNKGRLWISTDQGSSQRKNNIPDGMYACDLDGPGRGLTKFFYAVPRDAEMCGPCFTPNNTTLFVAVQHPGESKDSTFSNPSTRFPDFADGIPPRPSIVALTKDDGGVLGEA